MALIKCPECKKKVSDQCSTCPHCGYSIQEYMQQQESVEAVSNASKKPKKTAGKTKWIIGIAASCVVLAITAFLVYISIPFAKNTFAIEAADASVVTIFCYDYDGELSATGSGFIAFDSETVITNYHVMTSAYTCKISTNQDVSYEVAKILDYSKEQDIAILQLAEDTGLKPLNLGDSGAIKKGEPVVAIGSPLGIKNTVSTGVLSGRLMKANMDVLQFTAPISSGSSGGALFDNNGKVIGITYASYIDGQNLNLAIPIEKASDLYQASARTWDVSAIYIDEHPYVTKLTQYDDVPEITIDQLLNNPEAYNDKTIKVYGYFSSIYSYWIDSEWGKYIESFTPHELHLLYIAPKAKVTGNGVSDNEVFERALRGIGKHQFLEVVISDDRFFLSESVLPGDLICWIGEISYWETSYGNVHFDGFTDLCFSVN